MAEAALRKFIAINLVDPVCLDSPAIKTLLTGASNLAPGPSKQRNYRLALNLEALKIVSIVIRRKDWSKHDKNILWALFLVTYWGSIRVGDITSSKVNSTTAKCLLWNEVKFVKGNKLSVHILSPKSCAGNQGEIILIGRNPDRAYCPVSFMEKIKPKTESPTDPVFKFDSGKLITITIVNGVLREVSTEIGIPEGAGFSAHSLRAAQPTEMARHSDMFSQAEIRASGRWRSSAADRYVRAKADVSEQVGAKLYNLQFNPPPPPPAEPKNNISRI